MFSYLNPISSSSENLSSEIERNEIKDFSECKTDDENDIRKMIQSTRSYTENHLNQVEHSRNEMNNSCEFVPSSNMIRFSKLFSGIPLYFDEKIQLTQLMIEQSRYFALLLSSLVKKVFSIPIESVHLFRDIQSGKYWKMNIPSFSFVCFSARIAFNSNGSLFYNLRYFEQVYWNDLKPFLNGRCSSSIEIVRRLINFYYMVTCHELSHNIDANHDLNFINRLERVSARFMDQRDSFISTFVFQ